jgi:hypothetical protein
MGSTTNSEARPMPASKQLVLFLLLTTTACMKESAYVAPAVIHIDPNTYDEAAMISYRELARSDFLAEKCPPAMAKTKVVAVTVAIIRATNTMVRTEQVSLGDSTFYEANVDSFLFEARMSQVDSWWNTEHKHISADQMLEHEQIHFALFELAARRANSEIDAIRARIRAVEKTPTEAVALAGKRFRQEHARVQEAIMARSAQFDMETANGQRFDRNHEWADRIQRELDQTEPDI